jgi:TolB-like protein
MKHALWSFIGPLCASLLVSVCGTAWGQTGTLNAAPRLQSAKTPGKTNVAIINMKNASGVSAGETEVITDRLRGELFNTGKVNVMERDQMLEILKEQGFQQSGACTNEACMVEIGQLLGVEQLITGSLGKVGSMFLVNLRVIDVKTAKIMKVVSVDIRGDIDEVVSKLPDIAAQLVAQEAPVQPVPPPPAAIEKKEDVRKEEPKKVEQKPAETPAAAAPVVEKKEEPQPEKRPEIVDPKKDRNKNRGGIRVGMNLFGTHVTRMLSYGNASPQTVNYDDYRSQDTIRSGSLINFFFKGAIRAGRFITVDIGAGYSQEQTNFIETDFYGNTSRETHTANIFSIPSIGVNFVKRWFPLKINAGVLADLNILLYSIDFHNLDGPALYFLTINGGFGLRAGAEIMAGKHVGFNADFVYYYSHFDTNKKSVTFYDNDGNSTDADWRWSLTMPPVALGLGVNFYF